MEVILSIGFGASLIAIMICLIKLSNKIIYKRVRKENMSEIDFSKDKEYYRAILKEYSPEKLSYLDDFKIDAKRDIVAIILNLKLKRRIEINENAIIIVDSNFQGLSSAEVLVLKSIKDGKVKLESEGDITLCVQEDMIKEGLIVKDPNAVKKIKKRSVKKIIFMVIGVILFALFCTNVEKLNYIESETIKNILFLVIFVSTLIGFLFVMIAPVVSLMYAGAQMTSYVRTEKGEEINKKIEGLKKYIKDYSLLDEKSQKELIVWEEYLIYSVIFGLNNIVLKEMLKFVEIKYELGKVYIEKSE